MIHIAIAGASGYTGLELIRILLRHPEVRLKRLTSETHAGKTAAEVFPSLAGRVSLKLEKLDSAVADGCDAVFLAVPHTTAMTLVPDLLQRSACKIVDLSADYRLKDPAHYDQWYKTPHRHPGLLAQSVYGLPELHREAIRSARLVANPGCYPTSVILGLAPLMKTGWADTDSIIADCKSGVSGAGRKAELHTQFAECNESVTAYNIAVHRHTPEMEQELSALAGKAVRLTFSPHLVPLSRGMLATIYLNLKREMTQEQLATHYADFYRDEPFVRVLPAGAYAATHNVAGNNDCHIGVQVDKRSQRAVITSAIDNLGKGASGQAVQNMNLLFGFPETLGLDHAAVFP